MPCLLDHYSGAAKAPNSSECKEAEGGHVKLTNTHRTANSSPASPFASDQLSGYEVSVSKEQLAILARCWPALGKVQREAVIKMADAFLQVL